MSDDGTQNIVLDLCKTYPLVRLLENPKRLSSAGRNIGFRNGRGEYLSGLRRLSNEGDPTVLIRQMEYAQEFVSRIDFADKDQAIADLKECNAFEKPDSNVRLRMPG